MQTGFGRTGRLWARSSTTGVVPDLLIAAKSIAGGPAARSVTGRAEIMDAPAPGGLGRHLRRQPGCARRAPHAVLDHDGATARCSPGREAIGARVSTLRAGWRERIPLVGDVRGMGAMWAIELVKDRETRTPAKDETTAVVASAATSAGSSRSPPARTAT